MPDLLYSTELFDFVKDWELVSDPTPVRFDSIEKASAFAAEPYESNLHLSIRPSIEVEGKIMVNPAYTNAPFELRLAIKKNK